MPDSNSGDIDNLFRLAAEKYPLRTDSSDWEKVARALDKEDNSAAAFPQYTLKEKLIRRRYLLLLLLLPIAGIAYHNWKFSDTPKPGSSAKISIPAAQNTRLLEKAKNKKPGLAAKNYNRLDQQSAGTQNATGKIMASTAPVSDKSSLKKKKSAETGNLKNPGINLALQSGYLALAMPPNRHISEKSKEIKQTPAGRREQQQGDDNLDKEIKEEITWPVQKRITNFQIIPITEAKTADPGIGVNYITNALPDPVQKSQVNAAMKTNQPGPKTHLPLYAGLIIAPDMSEIKSQQVTGVGYTLGVLFGYPISSRFAVESGLYFDEKKYYTEGEYFSTKNVQFLNYVNLLNVNGSCKMLEVPLNLRYNIHNRKKNTWFVTGGLSNYFMFKEAYNYKYLYNGNEGEKYYSYSNASQNWFSILNFSAGYEQYLGKLGSLRIEPYLRIPLAGMGTGNLPITSAGLNIGITRQFR